MRTYFLTAVFMCIAGASVASTITSIDLNDFFFFPGDPVIVSADGSTATISESPAFSPILLSNDPGLGDPEVVIAAPQRNLVFDYVFSEPLGNDDEFFAFLIDAGTGSSLGGAFEFLTQSSSSGTVSFDVGSLVGTTLGLQFSLSALPGDTLFDSTLTVSNVALVDVSIIPLPASLSFLAGAMAGFGLIARRRKTRAKEA